MRIQQIRNPDKPVASSVTFLKLADAPLCRFNIRIIAAIQDHQLHIAEDILDGIIIGTPLGQGDPMELHQPAHQSACSLGRTGMGGIAIQHHLHGLLRIPASNLLHKPTHLLRALVLVKGPSAAAGLDIIGDEQIEQAPRALSTSQDPLLGPSYNATPRTL